MANSIRTVSGGLARLAALWAVSMALPLGCALVAGTVVGDGRPEVVNLLARVLLAAVCLPWVVGHRAGRRPPSKGEPSPALPAAALALAWAGAQADASVTGDASPVGALAALSAVFAAPVAEELIFRGAIQPYCDGRFGRPAAVAISAGLFALCHGRPDDLLWLVAAGASLASLREVRGLAWAILCHVLFNGGAWLWAEASIPVPAPVADAVSVAAPLLSVSLTALFLATALHPSRTHSPEESR